MEIHLFEAPDLGHSTDVLQSGNGKKKKKAQRPAEIVPPTSWFLLLSHLLYLCATTAALSYKYLSSSG